MASDLWPQYGLKDNPFFQDPLSAQPDDGHPLSLMVGRSADLALAKGLLAHAGESGRLVVEGAAGVGKTTFVNRLKRSLADEYAFATHDEPIRLVATTTPLQFHSEVLRKLLQLRTARLGSDANTFDTAAVEDGDAFWRDLVEKLEGAVRDGFTAQILSAGAGYTPVPVPASVPRTTLHAELREAVRRARQELRGRLLFHINNFENLNLAERTHASYLLAQVRDDLLIPGAHWLFVGPPNITNEVFRKSPQVAGIMQDPIVLEALAPPQVADLLSRRYTHLQRSATTPVVPPIVPADAATLYRSYVGDLRNFLGLLFGASSRVLGLRGVTPMTVDEIRETFQPIFYHALQTGLSETMLQHLDRMLRDGAEQGRYVVTRFRAADIEAVLDVEAPSARNALDSWLEQKCIVPGAREGKSQWFDVTGRTRIAFGITTDIPVAPTARAAAPSKRRRANKSPGTPAATTTTRRKKKDL